MKPKPRPSRPNEWWGIDMTKVMVEGQGSGYVVVVLDWYTKKIVGTLLGTSPKHGIGFERSAWLRNASFMVVYAALVLS